MFEFLLSKEEKCSRLFLTNYKIAFEYIPKICKRVCHENIPIDIFTAVNSWKPELRTIMNGKFYGAKMPEAFSIIDKDIIPFLIVGYSYTSVGLSTEPMCSIVVVDINRQKYRIFCMERFIEERYFLCGVDEGLHTNYGIDYDGLKINEFIKTAIEKGKNELLADWREENAARELKRLEEEGKGN